MDGTQLYEINWRTHLWAVLAIAKKDILHFFRYPLNAFFRIFEPIMWLTPIYFLGRTFASPSGNSGFAAYSGTSDYMSFILLGGVISNYLASVFWGMGYALKTDMDSGTLESNWMTPVPRPVFLIGQTLANLALTTFTSAGMLALAWLVFGFRITGNLLSALSAVVPMLVALYGFGFAFAAVVLLMRDVNAQIDIANYLIGLLSGSSFPVTVLPRFILPVSLAIPLTYGYDATRGYLLGTKTLLPLHYEVGILVAFMGVMIPMGYFVFRRVERRCRQLGTLSMR